SVMAASKSAMKWLGYYYTSPGNDGAWDQQIIQWHESGEFWNTYFHYQRYSADGTYDTFISSQMLLASFRDAGDFLGNNDNAQSIYFGRWNDDIGWWGLAALTAAEIFGPTAVIKDPTGNNQNGKPWFQVADTTFNHMLEQYDETVCGGGIYWSRNRKSSNYQQKYYKSSITNAEAVNLASRMFVLTGNLTYRQWGDKIYGWMKGLLITDDYKVMDGVLADNETDCSEVKMNPTPWSYHSGELITGLVNFYKATSNKTYLTEAHSLFKNVITQFVNPNRIIYEPSCEVNGGNMICKDPNGYSWALYRSFGWLFEVSDDEEVRMEILRVMNATARNAFLICDERWYCIRDLVPPPKQYTFPNGTNPRDQIEVVTILNTLAAISSSLHGVTINESQTQNVTTPTVPSATNLGVRLRGLGKMSKDKQPSASRAAPNLPNDPRQSYILIFLGWSVLTYLLARLSVAISINTHPLIWLPNGVHVVALMLSDSSHLPFTPVGQLLAIFLALLSVLSGDKAISLAVVHAGESLMIVGMLTLLSSKCNFSGFVPYAATVICSSCVCSLLRAWVWHSLIGAPYGGFGQLLLLECSADFVGTLSTATILFGLPINSFKNPGDVRSLIRLHGLLGFVSALTVAVSFIIAYEVGASYSLLALYIHIPLIMTSTRYGGYMWLTICNLTALLSNLGASYVLQTGYQPDPLTTNFSDAFFRLLHLHAVAQLFGIAYLSVAEENSDEDEYDNSSGDIEAQPPRQKEPSRVTLPPIIQSVPQVDKMLPTASTVSSVPVEGSSAFENELKNELATVRMSESLKSRYLHYVCAQIRKPGMSILQAVEGKTSLDEAVGTVVLLRAASLMNFADDVLAYQKLETGGFELNPIVTNISAFLQETFDFAEEVLRKHFMKVEKSIDSMPLWVLLDPVNSQQAILNIIFNSLQFSVAGSLLILDAKVNADVKNANIEITITDRACDLSENDIETIVTPYRNRPRNTGDELKSGLGVPIAERILKLMGGKLTIDSEKGKGCTLGIAFTCGIQTSPGAIGTAPPGILCQNLGPELIVTPDSSSNVVGLGGSLAQTVQANGNLQRSFASSKSMSGVASGMPPSPLSKSASADVNGLKTLISKDNSQGVEEKRSFTLAPTISEESAPPTFSISVLEDKDKAWTTNQRQGSDIPLRSNTRMSTGSEGVGGSKVVIVDDRQVVRRESGHLDWRPRRESFSSVSSSRSNSSKKGTMPLKRPSTRLSNQQGTGDSPPTSPKQTSDVNMFSESKLHLKEGPAHPLNLESLTGSILIVDDSSIFRQLLRRLLESFSDKLNIHEAGNGSDAVVLCASMPYDIIFMDLEMPKMNGDEATLKLRNTGVICPIIAVTGHQITRDMSSTLLQIGFTDIVSKPVTKDKVEFIMATFYGKKIRSLAPTHLTSNAAEVPKRSISERVPGKAESELNPPNDETGLLRQHSWADARQADEMEPQLPLASRAAVSSGSDPTKDRTRRSSVPNTSDDRFSSKSSQASMTRRSVTMKSDPVEASHPHVEFATPTNVHQQPSSQSDKAAANPLVSNQVLRHQFLVVDDSGINRSILVKMLQKLYVGCEVTEAANGFDALRLAGQRKFTMIFMDLDLPGMKGEEAAARIKAGAYPVPIVAVTGDVVRGGSVGALRQCGITEVVTKPINRQKLAEICKNQIPSFVETPVASLSRPSRQASPIPSELSQSSNPQQQSQPHSPSMLQQEIQPEYSSGPPGSGESQDQVSEQQLAPRLGLGRHLSLSRRVSAGKSAKDKLSKRPMSYAEGTGSPSMTEPAPLPSSAIPSVDVIPPNSSTPPRQISVKRSESVVSNTSSVHQTQQNSSAHALPQLSPMQSPPGSASTSPAPSHTSASAPGGKKMALIVDDSSISRAILTRILHRSSWEAHEVSSGWEALVKASTNNYDIIFMDLEMPNMDGKEVAGRLRASGFTRPIVAVTGNVVKGADFGQLEASGFNEALTKPVTVAMISEIIAKYKDA
ncbi:hydrolase 76 protein, partial [Blyttiomyces sp. JEL0837]